MTNTINGTRQLGDWEHQKFREDSTGKPAIAVVNPDGSNIGTATGVVSAGNSTTTPLGTNETFTGTWTSTLAYSEAIVSVGVTGSSASSVTDGLKVQWSGDGSTVHDQDVFTISADSDKTFSFPMQRPYIRVVYQNDGVVQTTFSLQLLLKVYASKGSSHRLQDDLVGQDDAIVTKSQIVGFTTAGGGNLIDVKVNPSGTLQVGGEVTVDLPVGAATEEQQIIQGEVLEEIEHAVQSIASAKGVAGDIRVTILSGTVTTVSTVTTVTTVSTLSNQSSMGGWTASSLVPATSNTTAVLSNINNVGV